MKRVDPTRASLLVGVRTTSISAVTNFRVVPPRLSILLPFFFFSPFLPPPRRICLGLISVSCRNHLLREGSGVGRTPRHKFPSCSKTNRVELIHFLSFWKRMSFHCASACIYTRGAYTFHNSYLLLIAIASRACITAKCTCRENTF